MALPFRLGFRDARQGVHELGRRVHGDQIDRQRVGGAEGRLDFRHLVLAQQAVVHEDARQLIADRPRQQGGDHAGIDAARQT